MSLGELARQPLRLRDSDDEIMFHEINDLFIDFAHRSHFIVRPEPLAMNGTTFLSGDSLRCALIPARLLILPTCHMTLSSFDRVLGPRLGACSGIQMTVSVKLSLDLAF
jgi:hypothetical protein